MRCLYEVLDVAKDADESAIRKAYRKAALVWHPDKNQGNLEVADARFKEIQNAWEVLSDAQEKAWYDSHRDQILRAGRHQAGGDGGHEGQAAPPEDLSLFQYFSSSCYSGFNDGPRGFYTVYGKVFMDLASQEAHAAEQTRNRQAHVAPGFGKADSPWSEVSAFYQYWLYFVSDRSFAWADTYNPASAPNRKVRRLMEDDNNKHRKAARRDFQENVRALVAFVRKRDARVIAWMEQEEITKAEHKAAEARRREEEAAERMRRAMEYEEPDWVRAADAGSCSSEGAALVEDDLYCIACDKFFKSEKALANHNRSKKHLQNTEILQAALAEEEAETTPDALEQGTHVAAGPPPVAEIYVPDMEAANDEPWQPDLEHLVAGPEAWDFSEPTGTAGSKVGDLNQPTVDSSNASETSSEGQQEEEEEEEDEDAALARMVQAHMQLSSSAMQKKKAPVLQAGPAQGTHVPASTSSAAWPSHVDAQLPSTAHPDASLGSEVDSIAVGKDQAEDTSTHAHSASHKSDLQRTNAAIPVESGPDQSPHSRKETMALSSQNLRSIAPTQQANAVGDRADEPGLAALTGQEEDSTDGMHRLAVKRKGKNRSARKKGAKVGSEGDPLTCQVCQESFDTRNILFRHIKEQGHARTVMT